MNRHFATVFLGLGLCQAAWGGGSPLPPYANYGVVTQAPVIDSPSFFNAGDFQIDTISTFSQTNLNNIFGNGYSPLPFMTKDTLYFTNTGTMTGYPGYRFDTGTSTSRHSASFFLNENTVAGLDSQAFAAIFSVPAATTGVPVPEDSQPIASKLLVLATNIINTGAMSVGNAGLLRMVGNNITNSYASLSAGLLGTVVGAANELSLETNDETGLQGQEGLNFAFSPAEYFFVPSQGVYDLFWGVTNGLTVGVDGLAGDLPSGLPIIFSGERGFDFFFNENLNTQYSVTATGYQIGTNVYYNIVFVNTNFTDPNISVGEGILPGGNEFLQYFDPGNPIPPAQANALENIIQISEPVYDVITGQTVTNGIYIIDDGAILPTMSESLNASLPGANVVEGYDRPNAFAVTTATPYQWAEAVAETNDPFYFITSGYTTNFIYEPGVFNNNMEALEISDYGAQIGRNPADLLGSFNSLIAANSGIDLNLEEPSVRLPDPTNDPGRIEITGANVDMTQTRLRAEGMLILNATNLTGVATGAADWGQANINYGVPGGAMVVSNVFPTTFQRVRGQIYVQSATSQTPKPMLSSARTPPPTNGTSTCWWWTRTCSALFPRPCGIYN